MRTHFSQRMHFSRSIWKKPRLTSGAKRAVLRVPMNWTVPAPLASECFCRLQLPAAWQAHFMQRAASRSAVASSKPVSTSLKAPSAVSAPKTPGRASWPKEAWRRSPSSTGISARGASDIGNAPMSKKAGFSASSNLAMTRCGSPRR